MYNYKQKKVEAHYQRLLRNIRETPVTLHDLLIDKALFSRIVAFREIQLPVEHEESEFDD